MAFRLPALSRTKLRAFARPLAGLAACAATAVVAVPSAGAAGRPSVDARERAVIERVNAVRSDNGLAPLQLKAGLSRVADRHSTRLHRYGALSHQLPGESALSSRLAGVVKGSTIGEVVFAASRAGSAQIVRAWMDSPGHRELLLSSSFRTAGIGVRTGPRGLFVTVDLAAR